MGLKKLFKKLLNRKSKAAMSDVTSAGGDVDSSFSVEDVPIEEPAVEDVETPVENVSRYYKSKGNSKLEPIQESIEEEADFDFNQVGSPFSSETEEMSVSGSSEGSFKQRDDWDFSDNSVGDESSVGSKESFDATTEFDREEIKDKPKPTDVKKEKVSYEFLEDNERTAAKVIEELEKSGLEKVKEYVDNFDESKSKKSFSDGLLKITKKQDRLINKVKKHYGYDRSQRPEGEEKDGYDSMKEVINANIESDNPSFKGKETQNLLEDIDVQQQKSWQNKENTRSDSGSKDVKTNQR